MILFLGKKRIEEETDRFLIHSIKAVLSEREVSKAWEREGLANRSFS